MANIEIKFGCFTFSGNYIVTGYNFSNNTKSKIYNVAQRNGIVSDEERLGATTITLNVNVKGTTVDNLRTNISTMIKEISAGKRGLYLYDDRYIICQKISITQTFPRGAGMLSADFVITFRSDSGFFQSVILYSDTEIIASSPTTYILTYDGDAPSTPQIKFIANQGNAVPTISFENLNTGKKFSYSANLPENKILTIECNPDIATVENDGVNDLGNYTGDLTALELVPGDNSLKYTGDNCSIVIVYYNKFYHA
uniref:Putative tail protein n=1 Tax=viral metagenome TaxID=1070528 RepID=A0A6M3IS11_9ZZZZ